VLLASVVLGLFQSVPVQEIGWEECLQYDLFCIKRVVIPYFSQSSIRHGDGIGNTAGNSIASFFLIWKL